MLSKKTNQALKLSGLAALALASACSEESEPSNNPPPQNQFDATVGAGDGGVQQPAGDAGAGGMCQSVFGLPPAVLCTTPAGGQGYRSCTNNVPMGDCLPISFDAGILGDGGLGGILGDGGLGGLLGDGGLGGLLGDGGLGGLLGDGGLGGILGDGGLGGILGDGGLPIEAGAIKCPTGYQCSSIGGALGLPISACAPMGQDLPGPGDCTMGSGPCKLNGATGTCQNFIITNACLVPCN